MNVALDPRDQKDLEALARAQGKDAEVVLRELVHEGLAERKRADAKAEEDELREQGEAWDDLLAELDTSPDVEPRDGLCASRDHDKILYGGPAPGQKGGFPERRS
ncbi:MAG: hypothetical protein HY721_25490 [Planctomycetes bacterium]|nr:hypothetical protein [Planctomycetota bacterium]